MGQGRGQIRWQVQPSKIQQRLKGMMSGEHISARSLPPGATVQVAAELARLGHVRSTQQTEFATGTESLRRNVTLDTTTMTRQVPLPGDDVADLPVDLVGGGSAAGKLGEEDIRSSGSASQVGMLTKTKENGEIFDGVLVLKFQLSYTSDPDSPSREATTRSREATARAGVRAIIERPETVKVDDHEATVWTAPAGAAPEAPETVDELRRLQGDLAVDSARKEGLPLPPERVWETGPAGGLPDLSVITDMWGLERLQAELDRHLEPLLGAARWLRAQSSVQDDYNLTRLMANLAAMTRGRPLEESSQLPEGLQTAATAKVTALMYRRRVAGAELAPQGESGYDVTRRLNHWQSLEGQPGFRLGNTGIYGLPTVGGQYRRRAGWRQGDSAQSVTNAKFPVREVYFAGLVVVSFAASLGDGSTTFDVVLPFEVGLPRGLGRKLKTPGVRALLVSGQPWPATKDEHQQLFRNPRLAASLTEPRGYLAAGPKKPAEEGFAYTAPEYVQKGRLSLSDFVLSIDPDGNALANKIVETLKPIMRGWLLGDLILRAVRHQVGQKLDTEAYLRLIPEMTNGVAIEIPVSLWNGWSGRVTVLASTRSDLDYDESVPNVEFENGTDAVTMLGSSVDGHRRYIYGGQIKVKLPFGSLSLTQNERREFTQSLISYGNSRETPLATVQSNCPFARPVMGKKGNVCPEVVALRLAR